MILFKNVTKRYDGHAVLKEITLQISGGEFVTLIGKSGAGKSTLISALIGAIPINKGLISVDGYDVTRLNAPSLQLYRRQIGVVFQDFKLLPQKTVYENIAFAMEVCGSKPQEIKQRVKEVMEIVGISRLSSQFPKQLSGWERQKTAIARALVHDPKLFIADEPTGNLDPEAATEILSLIQKINANGATVIIATHNQHLVDRLNKRVVVLDEGKMMADEEESGYRFTEVPDPAAEYVELQ